MVEVKVKCAVCGKEVKVGTHNIQKSMMVTTEDEPLWMTYFDCPHCSCRNFVQVDNQDTNALVEEESRLLISVMKQKRFGKTVHRKQSEQRKQIERDLAESRKELMLYVTGKTVVDCKTRSPYMVLFTDTTSIVLNH